MTKAKKAIPYLKAVQSLKKDSIAPVYFIFGEEKYLHDQLIEQIIDLAIDKASKDFNFDLFYANDVEAEKVVDIAKSYPMMAERRVVIVKDIRAYKPTSLKILADYVANPLTSTCLILTMLQKVASGKWITSMVSNSVAVDCRQLYENEISAWIRNYTHSKNMEIESQAILLLQAQVGSSLLNVVNELEKVQVNIHPRVKITMEDVQKVTSMTKQNNVFELCDAVGNKNFPKAVAILNNLLDRGEKPTGMIIQLTRHLTNIMKIKEKIRMGQTGSQELVAITRLHLFFIDKIKLQARNFTIEQLRRTFPLLADADLHLKTSYQQPKLVMEILLYKLIKSL